MPKQSRPGWFVWVLASMVLVPAALVFWAWKLPKSARESSVFLAGAWRGAVIHGDGPALLEADTSAWRPVKLPGGFTSQGLIGREVMLRRQVELPAALHGDDLVLILGYVRDATVRVYVNGVRVGVRGNFAKPFIGSESQLASFFVPQAIVRDGLNEVAFEIHSNEGERDGLTDSRIILGRHDELTEWAFHELMVRGLLELGGQLLIVALIIAVLVLWWQQGQMAPATLYAATIGNLLAAELYLLGKSGLLVAAVLSSTYVIKIVVLAVHSLGLVVPEFVETYFLGRVTWLRRINRVVSGGFLVGAMVLPAVGLKSPLIYQLYINWLFLLLGYAVFVAVRDLVRGTTRFGPIASTALLLMVGAGVNDLLSDLDIVFTPRLFTLAVSNLGIASAMVVIGEFLQLFDENRALSSTLSLKNDELAEALTRAQESARVKSEFLANTSHELRTPLNAIINIPQGLLELIDREGRVQCQSCQAVFELEAGEAFDPKAACPACQVSSLSRAPAWKTPLEAGEAARLLGSVVTSGTHLLSVVNDILDYSKIEAGRLTLHREQVDVVDLLEGVKTSLAPVAQKAGVTLVVDGLARGSVFEVDRVKLTQVLINLVSNAVKFSDGKGSVTVSTSVSDEQVRIAVRDEGIGIAPEHHASIFEGFRQVESGTTRRFGGTGLGLAISRKLVEAHGGTLRLSSALGQGSSFIVEVPRRAPTLVPDVESARTLLLVDDEVSALDATTAALRPLGLAVIAVRDPRDALEKARERRPELIILDVMMPRVSGLELLSALKADPSLRSIPVVVSSAYPDNRSAAEVAGAVFLAKPWAPGELVRVVEGLLSRPSPVPSRSAS